MSTATTTSDSSPTAGIPEAAHTLPDLLVARAAQHGDWVALDCNRAAALTYAQWERRSNALARGLRALGITRGSRIGLHFGPMSWIEYAVAYLAVHKCAATAFHLNDELGADEIRRRIELCSASELLTDREPGSAAGIRMHRIADLEADDGSPFENQARAEDLSDVLFTSGTTGPPKAVAVPHANTTFGRGPEGFAQLRDPKPLVVPMILGSNASATTMQIALASPTRIVLCPINDAARLAELTELSRASTLMINPHIAVKLLEIEAHRKYDLSCVETLASAAAPLSRAVAEGLLEAFPGAEITTTFASTEAVPAVIVGTYDTAVPSSLGRPARGSDVVLTDDAGAEVPAGELGEIRIKCGAPQRRYLDNAEADARVFQDGRVRTGDLARMLPDGRLVLFDRASEAVRTQGGLVSTIAVEAAIYAYGGVVDASVVSVARPGASDVVGIGVVLGRDGTVEGLEACLHENLQSHERPSVLVAFDALPRSQNGKVLKHVLRDQLTAVLQQRKEEK